MMASLPALNSNRSDPLAAGIEKIWGLGNIARVLNIPDFR